MTGTFELDYRDFNDVTVKVDGHEIRGLVRLSLDLRGDTLPEVSLVLEPQAMTVRMNHSVYDLTVQGDVYSLLQALAIHPEVSPMGAERLRAMVPPTVPPDDEGT